MRKKKKQRMSAKDQLRQAWGQPPCPPGLLRAFREWIEGEQDPEHLVQLHELCQAMLSRPFPLEVLFHVNRPYLPAHAAFPAETKKAAAALLKDRLCRAALAQGLKSEERSQVVSCSGVREMVMVVHPEMYRSLFGTTRPGTVPNYSIDELTRTVWFTEAWVRCSRLVKAEVLDQLWLEIVR